MYVVLNTNLLLIIEAYYVDTLRASVLIATVCTCIMLMINIVLVKDLCLKFRMGTLKR